MGNFFSNKKTTQAATTSNQSGSTQNNLWDNPGLQSFLQGYNQQFSTAGNFNAPVNSYQTGAADAQSGVSANLTPAFQTANTVGSEGITPANIQKFMTPYIKGVVDPTMQVQNQQNQQALANLSGNQAARGALGNNTGSAAAYMAAVQPAQQAQIAGLYQQGYGQATSTAAQDAALRLQGAGTAGSLSGVATGANTALGNLGQNIWQANYQNQITPYTLYNQGVQGFTGMGNLAGQKYSGNSSGTSNGTTSETPSLGSILFGLAGTAMSAYSDERVKDNIKEIGATFDGQPIYKYNYKGSPMTQIGLLAQDVEQRDPGAVGSANGIKTVEYDRATKAAERAAGGPVMAPYQGGAQPQESLIDKVIKASHALKAFRDGGSSTMADGGVPGYSSDWNTQVIAPTNSSIDYKKAGSGMSSMGSSLGKMSNDNDMGMGAIAAQQAELGRGLQSIMRPAFADGGDADRGVADVMRPFLPSYPVQATTVAPPATGLPGPAYVGASAKPAPTAEPSMGSKIYDAIGRPFSGGVWDGKDATAMQRAGAALTQIGNGPFAGVGQHILEQQKMRFNELAAERAAAELMGQYRGQDTLAKQQALGKIDGTPTVAARTVGIHEAMLPADMRYKEAQAKKAEADADKDYQRKLAEDKVRFETEQALAKQRAEWEQMFELRRRMQEEEQKNARGSNPAGNARLKWVPTPSDQPPIATVPDASATPAAPQPQSPTPSRNRSGMIIRGTATAPHSNKNDAGFGEYYVGPDGRTYRRGSIRTGDTVYNGAP